MDTLTHQNGYQAPFQPSISPQRVSSKSYVEIVQDMATCAKKNSMASKLVSTISSQSVYPLQLESLFWNKYNKYRNKSVGGAVCDQTILINDQRMPIIRKVNHRQSPPWNVSMDNIQITVGNESKSKQFTQTISLKQYLSNFNQYQAMNANEQKISFLAQNENDFSVRMDAMCCLVPTSMSGNAQFCLSAFNWKASIGNPSCLYIVSMPNGTSSVVIEGNFQKIFFNANGQKKLFSMNVNSEIANNQCIKIIQVPLRQKTRKEIEAEEAKKSGWGISNLVFGSNTDNKQRIFDVLPQNCKDKKVQNLLKDLGYHEIMMVIDDENMENAPKQIVSRSGVKIVPSIVPTYCCTRPLERTEAQSCYGESNSNITIACDGCSGSFSGTDVIWHCPETITDLHPNGYDLCNECATKQVIFDEFRGLDVSNLQRDERFPVCVTLLYCKAVRNGQMNEFMVNDIVKTLANAEKMAQTQQQSMAQQMGQMMITSPMTSPISSNIGSAMSSSNYVPPKANVNPSDYAFISNGLNGLEMSQYLNIFHAQNVIDSDLLLLNESDLKHLFVSLGPRLRFREWLNENLPKLKMEKMSQSIDQSKFTMIKQIFSSLNVVNASKYIFNFVNHGICDDMIVDLNDNDLQILIPEMAVRILFRKYLKKKGTPNERQQIVSSNNYLF